MKNALRLALALCALALAGSAAAQQQEPTRPQFGVGVSIMPLVTPGFVPTFEVYAPIQISPTFRLEPSLGIYTNDDDTTSSSDITFGLGAFAQKRVAPAVDLYVGGRLKLNFASFDNGVTDDSDTDFLLAAALGGEYYFVPKFSLGLEAQLGLYMNGDVTSPPGGDDGFYTTGLAFLRVYF